jgi:signal transduction histidine kinase
MYSINLFAGVGQKAYHLGDAERMNRSLVDLTETTQQAFKEMRLLVYELRPPALEQDDLVGALRHRLERVEQRANIETDFQVENGITLPDLMEEAFYYIAEEALNNALKHAAATAVTVRLDAGQDQIELEISDNGRGFEPDTSRRSGGLGLISMQERVEKLGGKLTVRSAPGAGTTVKAIVDRGGSNGQ